MVYAMEDFIADHEGVLSELKPHLG
jgi:hypothetical protein